MDKANEYAVGMGMGGVKSLFLLPLFCFCHEAAFGTTEGEQLNRLQHLLSESGEFQSAVNHLSGKNYAGTQCLDLSHKKQAGRIGLICFSLNENFIRDVGIVDVHSVSQHARPADAHDGYMVVTPVSANAMRKMRFGDGDAYSAVTDCDYSGSAIYRPTATCYVAYIPRQNEPDIYVNVLMADHLSKRKVTTDQQVEKLWSVLRRF